MGTKHTPGPWIVCDSPDGLHVTMEHGVRIAELYGVPSGRFPETPEANARLISAAPDLLEALEAWMEVVDEVRIATYSEETQERMRKGRAALAKATEAP